MQKLSLTTIYETTFVKLKSITFCGITFAKLNLILFFGKTFVQSLSISNTYYWYVKTLSGVSLEYLFLVHQNPFCGTVAEHPHDHIEHLEDMMDDEYNRWKLIPFSLQGDARKWVDQLPTGSLTCWKEIRNTFINQFFD